MNPPESAHTVGPLLASRSYIWIVLVCLACACELLSTPSFADAGNSSSPEGRIKQSSTDMNLKRIFEDSGVLSQFSNLPLTIIGESEQAWQDCGTAATELVPWINSAFSLDEMTRLARAEAEQALDAATIQSVIGWMESPSGQAIIHAERASASLSEEDFERYVSELANSPGYEASRSQRIRSLVNSTRAAEFVSVLNVELNAIVSLSSACSPAQASIQQLLTKASIERQDLDLVTIVVGLNLQAPTAVVYRELDDAVIDDYLQFSESAAGQAYHVALTNITRNVLVDRLEALGDWYLH